MYSAADITRMLYYKSNIPAGTLMFRDVLLNGVDSIEALQGITVTGGRLNVFNAVVEISSPIVPVELVSFNYELLSGLVKLSWITATEINNIGFEVLRSEIRNDDWKKVGFVPGFGTTTEYRSYNFLDESVAPGNYSYRLKQIDFSGEFEYSDEIEVEVNFPDKFSLEQNYPNPFNPSTIIQYAVSSKQLVQIKVFDVLGNEIMTLVDEEKSEGTYEVEFSAEGLSSGIYIYKMQTGSFVDIKKMSLIR